MDAVGSWGTSGGDAEPSRAVGLRTGRRAGLRSDDPGAVVLADGVDIRGNRLRGVALRQAAIGAALEPIAGDRAGAVAERLIEAFGSLAGFLRATPEAIDAALGRDAWVGRTLLAARAVIERGQREALSSSAVDPASPALRGYLATVLSGERDEALHAVFADRRWRTIAEQPIAVGGISRLEMWLRTRFSRCGQVGPVTVLRTHRPPHSGPRPSEPDFISS